MMTMSVTVDKLLRYCLKQTMGVRGKNYIPHNVRQWLYVLGEAAERDVRAGDTELERILFFAAHENPEKQMATKASLADDSIRRSMCAFAILTGWARQYQLSLDTHKLEILLNISPKEFRDFENVVQYLTCNL